MSAPCALYLTRHPHRLPGTSPVEAGVRFDAFRGSGPGGQKRNKTSSAVRAVHDATGLTSVCDDTRSQPRNRELAERRLRLLLTVRCRDRVFLDRLDPPANWSPAAVETGAKSESYLTVLGYTLDVLCAAGWVVSTAAEKLGTTTARLSRMITADEEAHEYVNQMRRGAGLKPLERRGS